MRKWWDELSRVGPKYGYYPNAIKTIMIVKDPNMLDHAKQVFAGTDTEGDVGMLNWVLKDIFMTFRTLLFCTYFVKPNAMFYI